MFTIPKSSNAKMMKYSKDACAYQMHNCVQPRFENYDYCFRHILEDKSAPYKQCSFINPTTNRRCQNPTPKSDRRDNLHCAEHLRKSQLRHRQAQRSQPPRTAESLLSSISHYVKPNKLTQKEHNEDDTNTATSQELISSDSGEKEPAVITRTLNPFVDIDSISINNAQNQALEYCSDSDSDIDVSTLEETLRIKDEDSSDAESIDSSGEDTFKHAGVYTPEEVLLKTKEKLQRLRNLYIDQFKRLQHVLKERRRDYLSRLQKEKETLCSISNQPRTTQKDHRIYSKLKSLTHYHKKHGVEAVLYKKSLERRALVSEGATQKASSSSKCIFTEGGVKCLLKTLPCAKYCNKHILEDPNQNLFKICGTNKSDSICHEPVMQFYNNEHCVYHYNIPSMNLVYNTSISSDEEEHRDKKRKLMSKTSTNTSKKVKVEIKTEIKKENVIDAQRRLLDESLSKSALYAIPEKEESKMMDLTEELPLQIMESKEIKEEVDMNEHVYHEQFISNDHYGMTEECIVTEDSEIDVCNE